MALSFLTDAPYIFYTWVIAAKKTNSTTLWQSDPQLALNVKPRRKFVTSNLLSIFLFKVPQKI